MFLWFIWSSSALSHMTMADVTGIWITATVDVFIAAHLFHILIIFVPHERLRWRQYQSVRVCGLNEDYNLIFTRICSLRNIGTDFAVCGLLTVTTSGQSWFWSFWLIITKMSLNSGVLCSCLALTLWCRGCVTPLVHAESILRFQRQLSDTTAVNLLLLLFNVCLICDPDPAHIHICVYDLCFCCAFNTLRVSPLSSLFTVVTVA